MNRYELVGLSQGYSWRYDLTIEGALQSPRGGNDVYYLGQDKEGWFYGYQQRGKIGIFKRATTEEEAINFFLAEKEPSLLARSNCLPTSFESPVRSKTIDVDATRVTPDEPS